jgi:hypothetical protein
MSQDNIKTGNADLDNDLKELYDLLQTGERKSVVEAIENTSISLQDFIRKIPLTMFRLARNFEGKYYTRMLSSVAKEAIPQIEDAKQKFESNFAKLRKHPFYIEMVKKTEESSQSEELLSDRFNIVSSVVSSIYYSGSLPKLTPCVRFAFKNSKGKIIFDSNGDVDDLSFIAFSFLKLINDSLKEAKLLFSKEMFDSSSTPKIEKRIGEMQKYLEDIKTAAQECGMSLDSKSDGKTN